jgi:hypothetical protein
VQGAAAFGGDAAEGARFLVPERLLAGAVFADAGAAEDDDGRSDMPLFEQEAHAAHLVAQQKFLIERGEPIRG